MKEKPISAFPQPFPDIEPWAAGMTLRDYFAAKAMAVLMREETKSGGFYPLEETADMAYAYADAMLMERAK